MLVLLLLFIMPFYMRKLIAEQCFFLCLCFLHRAVLKVSEASFVFCCFNTWWWNYLFIRASTNLHQNTFVIICDKKKSPRKLTMKDIESIDPEFYNSLIWVSLIFFHIVHSSCYFLESKAPTEWILNGSCSLCGIGNARFDWSFSEEDNQIYDMLWMNHGARQQLL